MDRQEKHRQHKATERADKNKEEKAYEAQSEKARPPVNAIWLIAVGSALVLLVIYFWTVGFARPW